MAKQFDLEKIFTYHRPFGSQTERYQQVREAARYFAMLIQNLTPASREQSCALTSLQETTMWANAAIANNEAEPVVTDAPIVGDPALGLDREVVTLV